jgi:hypothetical protein
MTNIIPNGSKIEQMSLKYTNFSHCNTLQNFWFENVPSGNPGKDQKPSIRPGVNVMITIFAYFLRKNCYDQH